MDDFASLSNRIRYLLNHYNKSQRALARIADVKAPSVSAWLNGTTLKINSVAAKKISDELNVSLSWLIDGKGDPDPQLQTVKIYDDTDLANAEAQDVVFIPEYDISFGCGAGRTPTWEEEHTVQQRAYPLSFFQKKHVNPKRCMFCYIEGDSMEPTLYDGDVVLIDTSQKTDIISGKVYAFRFEDHLRIKRLYRNLKGDITVRSDNPDYGDDVFHHDDEDLDIALIGRVIDRSGSGNL